MSTELELKEKIKAEAEEAKADLDRQREDRCPSCGAFTDDFPYITMTKDGWMECVQCGIVFCPLSIRRVKIERATQAIKVPKLVIPKH